MSSAGSFFSPSLSLHPKWQPMWPHRCFFDFGAMDAAWKMVQGPFNAMFGEKFGWKTAWESADIKFRTGSHGEVLNPNDLLGETIQGGLQNGYKLGPMLGVFQRPMMTGADEGILTTASRAYQKTGVAGTVAVLSAGNSGRRCRYPLFGTEGR